MTPEGKVQDECLRELIKQGWYAFITKNQGTYDEKRKTFRNGSPFVIRGMQDAIAIKAGRVLFIEFKSEDGVQSLHQKKFERAIKRHKGEYFVISSLEQCMGIITTRG